MATERQRIQLGMGSKATRRDFMGSTLLGAGAALMSGASSPVHAHSAPHGIPGLDASWTGPGGVGDYQTSNGNTHAVINAAHEMRDALFEEGLAALGPAVEETYDLIIVGGGFAGVTAAYTHNKATSGGQSILVLDNHPIFGGEAKQNEFDVDGTRLYGPQGSNGNLWPVSVTKQMGYYHPAWTEIGLPDEFSWQNVSGSDKDLRVARDVYFPMLQTWESADSGYYYGKQAPSNDGWVKNPWNNGFRDAPISDRLKLDYMTMESYRMPPRREDWAQWLDSMSYQEFLTNVAGVSDGYTDLVDPFGATVGLGLGADASSAYAAYEFAMPGPAGYFRYENNNQDPTDDLFLASFPGGNAGVLRHFLKKIIPDAIQGGISMTDILFGQVNWKALDKPGEPVRFRGSSTVVKVRNLGRMGDEGVEVIYYKDKQLHRLRAKNVIMAANQAVNKKIVADLPAPLFNAMDSFLHAPCLVVNVALRNWKFMEKMGVTAARWFEGFGWFTSIRRQMVIDGKEPTPLDPSKPVVLTMYVPFLFPGEEVSSQAIQSRYALLNPSFADFEIQIREQFQTLFGHAGFDAKRDIAGIVLNRWGHAYVIQPPGFYFGKNGNPAPKDIIRQEPYGHIAFAHAELQGAQVWQTACMEGQRAAEQILAL